MAFRYEEEVRVIYSNIHHPGAADALKRKLGKGFSIGIEPNILISRIFVSPKSDDWFFDLVSVLSENYQLPDLVYFSQLHVPPYRQLCREQI